MCPERQAMACPTRLGSSLSTVWERFREPNPLSSAGGRVWEQNSGWEPPWLGVSRRDVIVILSGGPPGRLLLPSVVEASGFYSFQSLSCALISVYLHSFAESLVGLFDLGAKKVLRLFPFILYSFAS